MTAPSDLIRRDAAIDALALVGIPPDDVAMESIRALPADPVAEAAGKLAASIGVPLVSCDYDTVCSVCHRTRDDLKEDWVRMTFTHAPDCAWETYRAAVAARDAGEGAR